MSNQTNGRRNIDMERAFKYALDTQPVKPTELLNEQDAVLRAAHAQTAQVAERFLAWLKSQEGRPDMKAATTMLFADLQMQFGSWSRDDMAALACMYMAHSAAQWLKDNGQIA